MIGLLIVLGILLLFGILLMTPAVFQLDFDHFKDRVFWRVSWFGISLFSSDASGLFLRSKSRSKKKSAEKQKNDKESKEKTLRKLKRYERLFRDVLSILPKPLRLFWKGISVQHLVIGAQVGRFDAKECALAYGKISALVYTGLGLLQSTMRIKTDQVQLQCAFGQEKTRWVVRFRLYCCPLAAVAALFSFAIGYGMKRSKMSASSEEPSENTGGKHNERKQQPD